MYKSLSDSSSDSHDHGAIFRELGLGSVIGALRRPSLTIQSSLISVLATNESPHASWGSSMSLGHNV